MTIARGTFYSPYLDSGQLAFTCLMLASAVLLVALASMVSLAARITTRRAVPVGAEPARSPRAA